MFVGKFIEYLLGLPVAAHEPRAAQQAQVMADQRLRQVEARGDLADRLWPLEAEEQDAQARRVAEQPECLGEDRELRRGREVRTQCLCPAWL